MAKVTAEDLKKDGHSYESYGSSTDGFTAVLDEVITEQSSLLVARIGQTAYDSSTFEAFVKRAERCLCNAELLTRRINYLTQSSGDADGLDVFKIRKSKAEYLNEADDLITRISKGVSTDSTGFASAAVVYDED